MTPLTANGEAFSTTACKHCFWNCAATDKVSEPCAKSRQMPAHAEVYDAELRWRAFAQGRCYHTTSHLSPSRTVCVSLCPCMSFLLQLSLPVPVLAGTAPKQQQGASGKLPKLPGSVSLLGCLQRFVRPERLGTAEQWVCGGCSRLQHAVKQMSVHRLPPVLCLHVKRFEHTVRPRLQSGKNSTSADVQPSHA